MMKPEEALEKYYEKFGERFPYMCFRGMPDEELVEVIQKAIESGKPVELPELNSEQPPIY